MIDRCSHTVASRDLTALAMATPRAAGSAQARPAPDEVVVAGPLFRTKASFGARTAGCDIAAALVVNG